jgi:predicted ABC-type ATPase
VDYSEWHISKSEYPEWIVKYDPDQPREPAGSPGGGRWTSGGGGGVAGPSSRPEDVASPSDNYPVANPDGEDTLQRFTQPDGTLTPERRALHETIIADHLAGRPTVEKPVAYFMGGGPASGKSTIIRDVVPIAKGDYVEVNPDLVKRYLPEFNEIKAAGGTNGAPFVHEESSSLSKEISEAASAAGKNILYDGTGDGSYESLVKKVGLLKAAGMEVDAHYVTVDTDTAIQRSRDRALKPGENFGRHVPEQYIRQVHQGISELLPRAMRDGVFDKITLWDTNTHGQNVKVASAVGSNVTIHDQAAWNRFLAKARK